MDHGCQSSRSMGQIWDLNITQSGQFLQKAPHNVDSTGQVAWMGTSNIKFQAEFDA